MTLLGLGPKVFVNCAGFIKIDTATIKLNVEDSRLDDLDSTRIHPEAYDWARKMITDALELPEIPDDMNAKIAQVRASPKLIQDLALEEFAHELERQVCLSPRFSNYLASIFPSYHP